MFCSKCNNLNFVWRSKQYNVAQKLNSQYLFQIHMDDMFQQRTIKLVLIDWFLFIDKHKDEYEIQEFRYNVCV